MANHGLASPDHATRPDRFGGENVGSVDPTYRLAKWGQSLTAAEGTVPILLNPQKATSKL